LKPKSLTTVSKALVADEEISVLFPIKLSGRMLTVPETGINGLLFWQVFGRHLNIRMKGGLLGVLSPTIAPQNREAMKQFFPFQVKGSV
jgi:hypothetical protein